MKKFIEKKLGRCASRVISRYKPFIVGITGSVGKTAAKNCIGTVLAGSFNTLVSPKNYNTEFGLPLTVLGLQEADKSGWRWLCNLKKAQWRAVFGIKDFADTLVLEMAADHPGDIAKLTTIAPPNIAVVTTVGESHLEFFKSIEAIAKEKACLIKALPVDGVAILNRDDDLVWMMRHQTKAKVVSFGFNEQAEVRALPETVRVVCREAEGCGTHFKVAVGGSTVPVFVPGALGRPIVYAVLAAVAVGRERGLNLMQIAERLRFFEPAPGRLRYLTGIKHTTLIDDTYNASPKSMKAALEVLSELPLENEDEKRFAILGDMLELGANSPEAHVEVGRLAAKLGVDYLVFVGERMGEAHKAAEAAGMNEDRVMHFASNAEAGKFVQEKMKQGDVILIKGSRGMKMEEVVKELMAEPLRAAELLAGDHKEWKN